MLYNIYCFALPCSLSLIFALFPNSALSIYFLPNLYIPVLPWGIFSALSFTSFHPSLHHSILNCDELTFLRNNAITSMGASHYACVCVSASACRWVSLCVHDKRRTHSRSLPGEKQGYSLLFLLLFQITVCFINAMVIWDPLPVWVLCFSKWRKAQRNPLI